VRLEFPFNMILLVYITIVPTLTACTGTKDWKTISTEAPAYALSCAESICKSWQVEDLRKEASPELVKLLDSDPKTTKKVLALCSRKLGKLDSCENPELRLDGVPDIIQLDGEHVYITVIIKGKFERDKGTITEKLNRHNKEWKLDNFHVDSSAFLSDIK
jgi:hypothetical protein